MVYLSFVDVIWKKEKVINSPHVMPVVNSHSPTQAFQRPLPQANVCHSKVYTLLQPTPHILIPKTTGLPRTAKLSTYKWAPLLSSVWNFYPIKPHDFKGDSDFILRIQLRVSNLGWTVKCQLTEWCPQVFQDNDIRLKCKASCLCFNHLPKEHFKMRKLHDD